MQYIPWDDPRRDCSAVWFEHPRRRQRPASNCPTTFPDHQPRPRWKTVHTIQTANSERWRGLQESGLSLIYLHFDTGPRLVAVSTDPARQTGRHSFGRPGYWSCRLSWSATWLGCSALKRLPHPKRGGSRASVG